MSDPKKLKPGQISNDVLSQLVDVQTPQPEETKPTGAPSRHNPELQPMHREAFDQIRALDEDEDRRRKETAILQQWLRSETLERYLKLGMAIVLICGLFGEVAYGDYIFLQIGYKKMSYPEWTVQVFFMGMFAQIALMAQAVVKNLFPAAKADSLSQIRDMVMHKDTGTPTKRTTGRRASKTKTIVSDAKSASTGQ